MDQSDERLLNFDKDRLAQWRPEEAERALAGEHADLYRNHLAIALWIDGYVERLQEGPFAEDPSSANQGYVEGVREIAAHLRQGDLLPEGVLLKGHFG